MASPRCYFIATNWKNSPVSHHFRALAKELVQRGHRAVLLIAGQRQDVEDHDRNPAIYTWASPRGVTLRDVTFLRKLIRTHHPDCLIANFGAGNVMMLVGRMEAVRCRVIWYRTMSTAIDLNTSLPRWRIRLLRLRKRIVYRAATHLVANSEAARNDIRRAFDVPERKCRVFYDSLIDPLEQLQVRRGSLLHDDGLICVGVLSPAKGQDVLIRAMALLRQTHPHAHVDFLGDGVSRGSLMQLAQQLGVQNICRFVGDVPHSDVLARMASAIATIVPSRSEALGLVNIESLAVGTPVVASHVGGISEVIRDGVDGFLVPPDDPKALADSLRALLLDRDLAEAMGSNGRQRFLAKFEETSNVRAQAEWLDSIVAV
jgi:glycosyltransferase involved in cell wall biosynthesis